MWGTGVSPRLSAGFGALCPGPDGRCSTAGRAVIHSSPQVTARRLDFVQLPQEPAADPLRGRHGCFHVAVDHRDLSERHGLSDPSGTPSQVAAARCFTWNSRRPERPFPRQPAAHSLPPRRPSPAGPAGDHTAGPLSTWSPLRSISPRDRVIVRAPSSRAYRAFARRVLLRADVKRAAADGTSSSARRPVSVRASALTPSGPQCDVSRETVVLDLREPRIH